jgi:hypothetical protein
MCDWKVRGCNHEGHSLSYLAEQHAQQHPVVVVSTIANFYKSPLQKTWNVGTGRGTLNALRRAHNAPYRGKPQGAEAVVSTSCGAPNPKVGSQGQRRIRRASSIEAAYKKLKRGDGPILTFMEWKGEEKRYELLF